MPIRWKLLGVAGLTGVAAGGAVLARRRRTATEYDPDELRAKLHARLAQTRPGAGAPEGVESSIDHLPGGQATSRPPGGAAPPA